MENRKRIDKLVHQLDALLWRIGQITLDHKNAEELAYSYREMLDIRVMLYDLLTIEDPQIESEYADRALGLIEQEFVGIKTQVGLMLGVY